MLAILQRFFAIRNGEGALLRYFGLLTFTLFVFLTIGHSAVDSLFMAYAGGKMIPFAWIALGGLAISITPQFARLTSTQPPKRMFFGILVFGVVSMLGMWLLAERTDRPTFVAFYAIKELYALFLLAYFWTYLNGFLDTQQAKRFFPLLGAVWSVGDFVGGRMTGMLAHAMGARQLFLLWAAGTLLLIPLILIIERKFVRASPSTGKPVKVHFGPLLQRIRSTPLLAGLTMISALSLAVAIAMRFRYYDVFGQAFPKVEDGAAFLGNLRAYTSLFKFAVGMFVLPQLVKRLGVRNVLIIYPVGVFFALVALSLFPGLPSATLGFFIAVGLAQAIYEPATNLTFNLLSPGERATLRSFFSGIMNPLGAVTASLLLLAVSYTRWPEPFTAIINIALATLFVGAIWLVRKSYIDSVLRGLQLGGQGFFKGQEQGPLLPAWIEELEGRWENTNAGEKKVILEFFLSQNTLPAFFADRALVDPDPSVRAAFFSLGESRWPLAPERLTAALRDESPLVRSAAARYAGKANFDEVDTLSPLLSDSDPRVRAEAAVTLWSIGDLRQVGDAVGVMNRALAATPDEQIPALLALGRLGDPKYLRTVLRFASYPDPAVRKIAARTVRFMAAPSAKRWVNDIGIWLHSARGEERHDLIDALALIGGSSAVHVLLHEAHDSSTGTFFKLRDAIKKSNTAAIIPSLSVLTDRAMPLESRILALSAVNHLKAVPRKLLIHLAQDELQEALRLKTRAHVLGMRKDPGSQVLSQLYQERAFVARTFVIRCLFAWNRYHGVRWVEQGLRSAERAQRANAMEALLNLTPSVLRENVTLLMDTDVTEIDLTFEDCLRDAKSRPGRLWQEAAMLASRPASPGSPQTV